MVNKLPQCTRCFGQNWIDLGKINEQSEEHLYTCGGGLAHADSDEMKQGCMRVIRTTPDDMNKGGVI